MARITTDVYVLDTSAIMTFIEDEAGFDIVENLLIQAEMEKALIFVSFMTFMETHYISLRERGEIEAKERLLLLNSLPVLRIESTEEIGVIASKIKSKYNLSVADAWIAALTKQHNATLIHKDPEFDQLGSEIKVLKLPYKTSE